MSTRFHFLGVLGGGYISRWTWMKVAQVCCWCQASLIDGGSRTQGSGTHGVLMTLPACIQELEGGSMFGHSLVKG